MDYITILQNQLGLKIWLIAIIFLWSFIWKLLALWKSARKSNPIWFIILAIMNTVGILEILYIYVFSEMPQNKKSASKNSQKTKKKTVKKTNKKSSRKK
jgi:methionyl-tRNA synthetase